MPGCAPWLWLGGIQGFDTHLLDPWKCFTGLGTNAPLFTVGGTGLWDIYYSGGLTNDASIATKLTDVEALVGEVTDSCYILRCAFGVWN
jgi:hypothetical protein